MDEENPNPTVSPSETEATDAAETEELNSNNEEDAAISEEDAVSGATTNADGAAAADNAAAAADDTAAAADDTAAAADDAAAAAADGGPGRNVNEGEGDEEEGGDEEAGGADDEAGEEDEEDGLSGLGGSEDKDEGSDMASVDEPGYAVSDKSITQVESTSSGMKGTKSLITQTHVDDGDSSGASSSEEDEDFGGPLESTDLTWDLKRVIRSLRSGNQTATLISLCALQDYDLQNPITLGFLCSEGILATLCNILETSDDRCVVGALQVLCVMTSSAAGVRKSMSEQGVLKQLVNHLENQSLEIKHWTSELVGNMSTSGTVRRLFRKKGGIVKLVALLKTDPNARIPGKPDKGEGKLTIQNAATTLEKLTKSQKGRRAVRLAGFFPLILDLLALDHVPISVPVFGILANCLVEKSWGHSLATDTYVEQMVKGLETEFMTMQKSCADCITNLVQTDPQMLDSVREKGALGRLLKLLQMYNPAAMVTVNSKTEHLMGSPKRQPAPRGRTPSQEQTANDKVLKTLTRRREEVAVSVSGALWRCCASEENVKVIQKANGLSVLIGTLDSICKVVNKQAVNIVKLRTHIAGALAECSKFDGARASIGQSGGIPQLVPLLQSTENALLVRVAEAVGNLARDKANSRLIIDCTYTEPNGGRRVYLNGSRLLFSLLKKNDPEVQAMAAWASCRLLESAVSAEEISRELIGALELIVLLLMQSSDEAVLTEVCNLIGVIALDEENLSVLTDYGVVPALARNTNTPNKVLMSALSFAIGRCCLRWQNRKAFGKNDCVANMVSYLKHKDQNVNKRVSVALYELSRYAPNAITIHESGGVMLLLPLIGSEDEEVAEAAAGCTSNIRKIALANDKWRTNQSQPRGKS